MYDGTVQRAQDPECIDVPCQYAPKLEPEIVFKLKAAVDGDPTDPVAVLRAVEWLSLGYEIVDCPFADWQFQPPDLVAAFGFHAALVLGAPTAASSAELPAPATRAAQV